MKVKVGCCGFPVAHEKYYHTFSLVELQSTFYKLPRDATVQRWHDAAPSGFEFVVKAWQAITHPSSSPTWRRAPLTVGKAKAARYGYLQPTAENFEAFRRTLDVCNALGAHVCLIQCPPSFQAAVKNVRNLESFLAKIDRRGLIIAWELRGNWLAKPQMIRALCDKLEIVHVVDLLRREPASPVTLVYSRLHGLGERELNYGYRYSDNELRRLARKLSSLEKDGCKEAYILFNNVSMFEDAKRFLKLISDQFDNWCPMRSKRSM
jgi:uncharacterized protein YecE (DUF72 family)